MVNFQRNLFNGVTVKMLANESAILELLYLPGSEQVDLRTSICSMLLSEGGLVVLPDASLPWSLGGDGSFLHK